MVILTNITTNIQFNFNNTCIFVIQVDKDSIQHFDILAFREGHKLQVTEWKVLWHVTRC
jgi:hypothetical protein